MRGPCRLQDVVTSMLCESLKALAILSPGTLEYKNWLAINKRLVIM